ncbi:sel1 repeat family protein [Cognatilysobacter terrigena]|uniref:sel1 repeat family protein n=1 Tax=Cognatilysobacter terrigena TaxID=2488749 RepID=UPI0010602360|nr:sel1 repeat family protein [Lysobacter terrigena]
MNARLSTAAIALLLLAAPSVHAADQGSQPDARSLEYEMAFRGHPDLEFRMYGVQAYGRKQYDRALVLLRRAAHFGDKPSQGLIAEMYALGQGVPPDMALAYAWMDLAAERGYRDFIVRRERYWARMTEADRARALEVGQSVYAEYGDDVAKPRFADQLRRESHNGVGSRTGYNSNARIKIPSQYGVQTVDGTLLNSLEYWNADQYWALQDALWKEPGGHVDAGELQDVRSAPAASSDATRAGDDR